MSRLFKAAVLFCLCIFQGMGVFSQASRNTLTGIVVDKDQHTVVSAYVHLFPDSAVTVTDTGGRFRFTDVPAGVHTLFCDALGYQGISLPLTLAGDRHVTLTLAVAANELEEVVVNSRRPPELHTATVSELKGRSLLQTRGASLGEALKQLPGLNSVQTGPSLSKPVIHGLHSNRVLLVNDGVRQQGQQWGSEHAPEIDPFVANRISVIKGAASVRYGSDAIAGVVLMTPDELPTARGIGGDVYLIGASNGRMGAASASLQGAFGKSLGGLSWRAQGTLKNAGNFRTPGYYLINTGLQEGDFSLALGYKWKGVRLNAYYSQYNNKLGIFSGAESGNLKELLSKFASAVPATPSYFSYKIDRSYQVVNHELVKASASYEPKKGGRLELTFGRQNDLRREYDSDLPYNNNPEILAKPQLSFRLITHTLELVYTQRSRKGFSGSCGLTGYTSGNVFEGIRYLIPNFRDYNGGAFAIERYQLKKVMFEAGLRYDYRWLRVYRRDPVSLQAYHSTFDYNNVTGTVGATYRYNGHFNVSVNTGTAWRAPSINELYINGIHFSDASYQIGDSSLRSERALNTSLSLGYTGARLRMNVDVYYNVLRNYIYETPLANPVTTIGGTFPAFLYTQDNVNIKGLDASLEFDVLKHLTFQSKATLVRGFNETIHDHLIYMPCDRYENGLTYQLPGMAGVQSPYVSVENVSVLKQTRVPPNIDYVPPPGGYSLFHVNAGFVLPVKQHRLDVNLAVNNVANVAYRDYLNHFRYYADEIGRNFTIRLKYSF